jgi:hypothetical protein
MSLERRSSVCWPAGLRTPGMTDNVVIDYNAVYAYIPKAWN